MELQTMRVSKRYPIRLSGLCWPMGATKPIAIESLDLSSSGLAFRLLEPSNLVRPSRWARIKLEWPALLHGVQPMLYCLEALIVWKQGELVGARMRKHEFRVKGKQIRREEYAA